MTFEQFQATRVHVEDIGAVLPDYSLGADGKVPGFVYVDALFIEDVQESWPAAAKAKGKHYLLIANTDWISDDLASLERKLYDYAVNEGMA